MNHDEIKRLCPDFASDIEKAVKWAKEPELCRIDPKDLLAIFQALAEARKAHEWRPISEIPEEFKDGRSIEFGVFVDGVNFDYVTIGWFCDDAGHQGNTGYHWWDAVGECWRPDYQARCFLPLHDPTKGGE